MGLVTVPLVLVAVTCKEGAPRLVLVATLVPAPVVVTSGDYLSLVRSAAQATTKALVAFPTNPTDRFSGRRTDFYPMPRSDLSSMGSVAPETPFPTDRFSNGRSDFLAPPITLAPPVARPATAKTSGDYLSAMRSAAPATELAEAFSTNPTDRFSGRHSDYYTGRR